MTLSRQEIAARAQSILTELSELSIEVEFAHTQFADWPGSRDYVVASLACAKDALLRAAVYTKPRVAVVTNEDRLVAMDGRA